MIKNKIKNNTYVLIFTLLLTFIFNVRVESFAFFTDVDDSFIFYDAIEYAAENKIIEGYEDNTFQPNGLINRAELTKIVINSIFKNDEIQGENCFLDVTDQWFAPYICTAKRKGIIHGYPDGLFRPDKTINFIEMAKVVALAFDQNIEESDALWYENYVTVLSQKSAIPTSTTSLTKSITRGEMVEVIWRLKERLQNQSAMEYDLQRGLVTKERVPSNKKLLSSTPISPFDAPILHFSVESFVDDQVNVTFVSNTSGTAYFLLDGLSHHDLETLEEDAIGSVAVVQGGTNRYTFTGLRKGKSYTIGIVLVDQIGRISPQASFRVLGGGVGVGSGGSSSSVSATLSGVLLDSPVKNMSYSTPSFSGVTDDQGRFYYKPGETVVFTYGGQTIATEPAKSVITLLDFFDTTDPTDTRVQNMARFLQGLDIDGDPSNIIELPLGVDLTTTPVDFTQTPAAFEVDGVVIGTLATHVPTNTLPTAEAAIKHLVGELKVEESTSSLDLYVNQAPIISGTPITSIIVGGAYTFTPSSSDREFDTVTFSASNLPTWLTLNSATGALTGTPAAGDIGLHSNIVLTASDGTDTISLPTFSITVTTTADTTAPILSTVSSASITHATADLNFTSDEAGAAYVLASIDSTLTTTDVKLHAQTITSSIIAGAQTKSITGLVAGTNYTLYVVVVDSSGNTSNLESVVITTTGGDTVSPVLSAPAAIRVDDNNATLEITSDEDATAYFLASATSGLTAAQVKADGSVVTQAVTASVAYTQSFASLTTGVDYYLYAVADDASTNESNLIIELAVVDTDGDGIPDSTDTDDDGDGVLDGADFFPLDKNEWADADNDGTGDNEDLDDNNDGVYDVLTEHKVALTLVNTEDATATAEQTGNWSDTATWGGTLPIAGDRVLIPAGMTVTVDDEFNASLMSLRVDGQLDFSATANTALSVDTMLVSGSGQLNMGTVAAPIPAGTTAKIIIDNYLDRGINRTDATGYSGIHNPNDYDPHMVGVGLISMGGIDMHGANKTHGGTLTIEPSIGDTTLALDFTPTGWEIGDEVVIAGTTRDALGDEKRTITNISGTTVTLDSALSKDHHTVTHTKAGLTLKVHVINLTRNVVIESEADDQLATQTGFTYTDSNVSGRTYTIDLHERRGHVMFMNSDVDIRYAGFNGMGRTNKRGPLSIPTVGDTYNVTFEGRNPSARYPVHFHKLGAASTQAYLEGNAIEDSPGWGYVNHSSNVAFHQNVAYDADGASFVTESGDEVGSFTENISIRNTGDEGIDRLDLRFQARKPIDDFAFGGHGFWYQGIAIESTDNVASGAGREAFTVYPFPLANVASTEMPLASLPYPDAEDLFKSDIADGQVSLDDIHQHLLDGDIAYGSNVGLMVGEHRPANFSELNNFLAWSVQMGVSFNYSDSVRFNDFTLIGNLDTPRGMGTYAHHGTSHIHLTRPHVEGFAIGLQLPRGGNIANDIADYKQGSVTDAYLNNILDFHFIWIRNHDAAHVEIINPTFGTLTGSALTSGIAAVGEINDLDDLDIDSSNVTSNGLAELKDDVANNVFSTKQNYYFSSTFYEDAVHNLNIMLPQIATVELSGGEKYQLFFKDEADVAYVPFPSSRFIDGTHYDSSTPNDRDGGLKNGNIPAAFIDKTSLQMGELYRQNADQYLYEELAKSDDQDVGQVVLDHRYPNWVATYAGNILPANYSTDSRFAQWSNTTNMVAMKIDDLPDFHPFLDYIEGPNVIENFGAESGLTTWTGGNETGGSSAMADTAEARTGSASFKLENLDDGALNLVSDEITMTPGTRTVHLSGWSKSRSVTDESGSDSSYPYTDYRLEMRIYFDDGSNTNVNNDAYFLTGTNDWNFAESLYTSKTKDIDRVQVTLALEAPGTAWFDDISLVATGPSVRFAFDDSSNLLLDTLNHTSGANYLTGTPTFHDAINNSDSADFDGTDDAFTFAHPFSLAYKTFTWQANVRPTDVSSGVIYEYKDGDAGYQIALDSGKLVATIQSDSSTTQTITSSRTLTASEWIHAQLVYDYGIGKAYLYIDGVAEGSVAIDPIKVVTSGNALVGGAQGGFTHTGFFTGYIDELQVSPLKYNDISANEQYVRYQVAEVNPAVILDSDNDGVFDHLDALPHLATETVDSDGDGWGDNQDMLPNDPNFSIPTNILLNADAENDLTNWTPTSDSGDDVVAVSTVEFNGGAKSFELQTPTNNSGTLKLKADPLTLTGDVKTFHVTGYAKTNAANTPRLRSALTFSDASTATRNNELDVTADWKQYSETRTESKNISTIDFEILMTKQTGAQFWSDDIEIYVVTENDNDNDNIDDSIDPDDDNDGHLDGEDAAPFNDLVQ